MEQQDIIKQLTEAISLLIDLAERGEIDPWDVQVVEVIDRYLSKITFTPEAKADSEITDLLQSGQAFVYASMLVLLKAQSLNFWEKDTDELVTETITILEAESLSLDRQLPTNLERQLQRRAFAQAPRKRKVTLQELIEQLQLMRETIAQKTVERPSRRRTPKLSAQAAKAIGELAHQENLVETAGKLDLLLREKWAEMSQGQEWMDLEELIRFWSVTTDLEQEEKPGHDRTKSDRVGIFWALLLLSAQSKVELSQAEFYQELKIKTI